jgi:hypothetical protein
VHRWRKERVKILRTINIYKVLFLVYYYIHRSGILQISEVEPESSPKTLSTPSMGSVKPTHFSQLPSTPQLPLATDAYKPLAKVEFPEMPLLYPLLCLTSFLCPLVLEVTAVEVPSRQYV